MSNSLNLSQKYSVIYIYIKEYQRSVSWICFAIHCSPSPYPTCFTKLDITNLQGRIVDCSFEFTCNIPHFVTWTSKYIVNHYSLTQNNFISIISFSFLAIVLPVLQITLLYLQSCFDECHLQQHVGYIVADKFISRGNQSIRKNMGPY
jgi:hypothetical protein